jgi:hypothetical protein
METYANKQIEFINQIKKFLPVLRKYGLTPQPQKISGDENTLYPSLSICFLYHGNSMSFVAFEIQVLTWKKVLSIGVQPGFFTDESIQSIDMDLEDFETELKLQIEKYDRMYPQDDFENN